MEEQKSQLSGEGSGDSLICGSCQQLLQTNLDVPVLLHDSFASLKESAKSCKVCAKIHLSILPSLLTDMCSLAKWIDEPSTNIWASRTISQVLGADKVGVDTIGGADKWLSQITIDVRKSSLEFSGEPPMHMTSPSERIWGARLQRGYNSGALSSTCPFDGEFEDAEESVPEGATTDAYRHGVADGLNPTANTDDGGWRLNPIIAPQAVFEFSKDRDVMWGSDLHRFFLPVVTLPR